MDDDPDPFTVINLYREGIVTLDESRNLLDLEPLSDDDHERLRLRGWTND